MEGLKIARVTSIVRFETVLYTFRIKTGHQEIAISANFIRVPQIWDPFDSFALFHRFLPLQRSRFNTESTKSMSNDVFKLFRIFEHI